VTRHPVWHVRARERLIWERASPRVTRQVFYDALAAGLIEGVKSDYAANASRDLSGEGATMKTVNALIYFDSFSEAVAAKADFHAAGFKTAPLWTDDNETFCVVPWCVVADDFSDDALWAELERIVAPYDHPLISEAGRCCDDPDCSCCGYLCE
jgi:hypothetical protein